MNDLRTTRPRALSRAYLFASGKGGSGKSTLCAGVAAALALSGKRVIAWDADLLMRNLDIYTGLYENALFDLSDVLEGRKTPGAALTPHPEIPGLSLLAAPAKRIAPSPEDMRRVAGELLPLCDYLLVDAPAGIDDSFRLAAAATERAVIVSTADLSSVGDAARCAGELDAMGFRKLFLAANRVSPREIGRGFGLNLDRMIDRVGIPLIGFVREDRAIVRMEQNVAALMRRKKPTPAARDMRDIARRLTGERVPLPLK